MTQKLFRFGIVIVLITISFFFSRCNKADDTGLDLVIRPGDELNTHYVDTLDIIAYSQIVDSIKTTDVTLHLLGTYKDDIFGTTQSQMYTQLRLAQNNIDFGSNAVCDSIVLSCKIVGFYGDSTETQTFKVYELDEKLESDSSYYHFSKPAILSSEIGSVTIQNFSASDSVMVDGEKSAPQIRIPLDNAFGTKILDKSGMTELSDNDNFIQFIKGLNVQATGTVMEGGMAYLEMTDAVSEVRLYYHNDDGPSTLKLVINEFCTRHNVFEHNGYADADLDFKNQVVNGDTALGQNVVYLQSMGGIETYIDIPHLMELQNENSAALASAEIFFKVEPNTDADNAPPAKLALVSLKENGKPQFLIDYFEGATYYDGIYDESSKTYRFRITRHIQKLLKGELENYGLKLIISGSGVQANRVVLAGPDAIARAMKLKLIYTDID